MSEFSSPSPSELIEGTPIHGPEGFNEITETATIPEDERIKVGREDLRPPEHFPLGSTAINLIVNVRDIRDPHHGEIGALYPDQAAAFEDQITDYMDTLYDSIPEAERSDVDVIVLAGEADLVTPGTDGLRSHHQRALETGDRAIAGIKEAMLRHNISADTALTTHNGRPIAVNTLDDARIMHPLAGEGNDEAYLEHLISKYGAGRKLWQVFEDDTEKETRLRYGAEGPSDIAARTDYMVSVCSTIAALHQARSPEKRVVVFAVGNYDNISPWVKAHVARINPAEGFIPIDKGGGLVIVKTDDQDSATTTIGGKTYDVDVHGLGLESKDASAEGYVFAEPPTPTIE